jgi:tetratricopeptide (TPR) repeat protein
LKSAYYKNKLLKLFALKDHAEQENNAASLTEIYSKIAAIYEKIEDVDDTLEWKLKQIDRLKQIDKKEEIFRVYYAIAKLHTSARLYDKALHFNQLSFQYIHNYTEKNLYFTQRANIFLLKGDLSKSEEILQEIFKIKNRKGYFGRVYPIILLGILKNHQHNFEEAKLYFLDALNYIDESQVDRRSDVMISLAYSMYGSDNYIEALDVLMTVEKNLDKINNNHLKLRLFQYTYYSYTELKNFENAFNYYKKICNDRKVDKRG